ncbi:MAG TPA: C25 family cysteine peptidase [Ignavibacteriaceae bacterium]
MKNILLFFNALICTVSIIYPQNKAEINKNIFTISFSADKQNFVYEQKGKFIVRDYYEFTDPSKAGYFKLPAHYFLVAIPPNSKPQISVISNEEKITSAIIPAINPKLLKNNDSSLLLIEVDVPISEQINRPLLEVIGYTWYRDFYCAVIKLNTHSYSKEKSILTEFNNIKIQFTFSENYNFNDDSPIQVKSEMDRELRSLIYNWEIAEQFRSKPNLSLSDSTYSWINFNNKYLKLSVGSDGIYRISRSDLENFGISASSINPKTFQLFKKGQEVSIYVEGEEDNFFDENDFIEFYGEKNYSEKDYRQINSITEDYNEYLNRYTDSSFYFMTWDIEHGKRIQVQNTSSTALDTINFYNYFSHVENNTMFQNQNNDDIANQKPDWKNNKSWYWQWIFTSPQSFTFSASDIFPNKPVSIFFKLVSAGSNLAANAHNIALKLNGTTIDSQVVNRFQQVLLNGSVSSNLLINGNNQIILNNYDNGTTVNFLGIDWYDVEHPKYLNLVNDSLSFIIKDQLNIKPVNLKIDNASTPDLIVYKVKNSIKKFEGFAFNNNSIILYDTLTDGEKFIVVPEQKILKPNFLYYKYLENLVDTSFQADYLATTHPKFLNDAADYVASIENMYSLNTKLISTYSIFDQFGFGYPTPESIRLFLKYVLADWKAPAPVYLNLIGDANYDFKGYILKTNGVRLGENYVPSYGTPVGDNWYIIFDENILPIPQMKLGRIPINEPSQLNFYKEKVQNNFSADYDDWNKRYLFFSGGIKSEEYQTLKAANDSIVSNIIQPKPIAGLYTHFYKTSNPNTDFGPFSPEQIRNAIDDGGVFISYVGHSGTATWDNSINNIFQLKNKISRNPLITDFGCSTNKFAEPDIICFGERFLLEPDGQAIGYIGNSSLGFLSTATTAPKFFYKSFIIDSTEEVGNAHLYSKRQLFNLYGNSETNKIYAFTNCILGDPAVRLKIPKLPNLKITDESIFIDQAKLLEINDSIEVKIDLANLGWVTADSLDISIIHLMNNQTVESQVIRRQLPGYIDSIYFWIKSKNLPGQHTLSIKLDLENEISELYENDNEISFDFTIYSSQLRDLVDYEMENSSINSVLLLNPIDYKSETFGINFQFSSDKDFSSYQQYDVTANKFFTPISINGLELNKRYWFRYKIDEPNSNFSKSKSFLTQDSGPFFLLDSISFNSQNLTHVEYDSSSLHLSNDSIDISVLSAGWYSGATCVIAKNGINLLSNSFFAGMGIVVFDPATMEVDTSTWYKLFDQPANVQALADLINSIPSGKIVAMGVANDARNNLSANLKNAIKTLGSAKIDSLLFRGSWAIIGKKGANLGEAVEQVRDPYNGSILIDSIFNIKNQNGYLLTNSIGPASEWNELSITDNKPSNSEIAYTILGEQKNGNVDTLSLSIVSPNTSLQSINADLYSRIKLLTAFKSSSERISPTISKLSVSYSKLPELGINYQVVSVDKDTIYQKDSLGVNFSVYNVGTTADSFKIKVELVKADNNKRIIFEKFVSHLDSITYDSTSFSFRAQIDDGTGSVSLLVTIDSENRISEKFRDNNFFSIPFYIKPDTTVTSVSEATFTVTYDGNEIIDGDYVSPKPVISMILNYPIWFPLEDTTAVEFYINQNQIFYSQLNIQHDTSNKRIIYHYTPSLSDGEYSLRVYGKNILGVLESSPGYEKQFLVANEAELLNVYNYPNPFRDDTYFSFRLTQFPDELKIKIYSVAGRLIKEIALLPSALGNNLNFVTVHWDGRDEDGDLVANGVYIYKVIMKMGDKVKNITQKLAVVR